MRLNTRTLERTKWLVDTDTTTWLLAWVDNMRGMAGFACDSVAGDHREVYSIGGCGGDIAEYMHTLGLTLAEIERHTERIIRIHSVTL